MAEYTYRQWENEMNEANNIHADDCYRWQAGIELAGGTWDGEWVDLDKTGKGLVTIDQFNSLESQIQSKVSSYTPKNYDPDSTVQIVPGVDGWNKVENGIITAVCKPDGTNINLFANSDALTPGSYNGSTCTIERNITVEEWNTDNASRCFGTGGSSATALTINPYGRGDETETYTLSGYFKNNSDNRLRVQVAGSSDYVNIESGEAIKVVSVREPAARNLQFNINTITAGLDFDFCFWHLKLEVGDEATDWTPCPTDYGYPSTTLSATPQSVEESDEVAAPEAEEIE